MFLGKKFLEFCFNTKNFTIILAKHFRSLIDRCICFMVEKTRNFLYSIYGHYTVKKVSDFPVPSRDVTNQTR